MNDQIILGLVLIIFVILCISISNIKDKVDEITYLKRENKRMDIRLKYIELQADAAEHVAQTYIDISEHRAKDIENLKQYEYWCKELDRDKQEFKRTVLDLKKQVIMAKGYIDAKPMRITCYAHTPAQLYTYHSIDLDKFEVTSNFGTIIEVYGMDQKGEIYPTKQAAGEELARLIKEDESNRDYIKTRYGKDKDGN